MAINVNAAQIRSKNNNANGSGTTTAMDSTVAAGANGALLLIVTSLTSVAVAAADITEGGASANTWTSCFTAPAGGAWTVRAFLATNPNTNAAHTFSVSKTGAYPAIAVVPLSGLKSSGALDITLSGFFSAASYTNGCVAPSQGNEAVIYAVGGGTATVTGPGTVTKQVESAGDGSTKGGISLFTAVQSTDPVNMTDTFTFTSQQGAACAITLRASSAGTVAPRIQGVLNAATGPKKTSPSAILFERTQPYTVWCQFFKYGNPPNPAVLYTTVGAGAVGHELFIGSGGGNGALGKLVVRLINTLTTNMIEVNGSTNVCDGKWRQAIVRHDGSSTAAGVTIALNDGTGWVAETMTTVTDNLSASIVTAGQSIVLGWQDGGWPFDMSQGGIGAVAKFVIENVRRSDAYLTANSALWAMPPNDANSLGRYLCYEGSGTTVHDTGPNGYDLTTNASWWAGDAGGNNDGGGSTGVGGLLPLLRRRRARYRR